MAKPKEKKPQTTYHHGDLRAALVAEARRMVERGGPDSVSLRAVAKAAGVSAAAPYHHFKDKHALLEAVAADGFKAFRERMIEFGRDAGDDLERLDSFGAGYVTFAVEHPHLFRLIHGPTFRAGAISQDLQDARTRSATVLTGAVSAYLPDASEQEILTASAAAWSIVHGAATLMIDGRLSTLIDHDDAASAARTIVHLLDIARVVKDPRSGSDEV